MSVEILKFQHPFTMIVAGGTGSGKTMWVKDLLENWKYLIKFDGKIIKVLWCYSQKQSLFNETLPYVEIHFFEGIPQKDDLETISPNIVVIDDLMENLRKDEIIQSLFTRISHHMNISVLFITQNIFSKEKSMRTISLNSHYIIVMKSVRLTQQVAILGNQIWPGSSRKIIDIYKKATANNFSYLIFDLHPTQLIEKFRIRNRIFNRELSEDLKKKYFSVPIYWSLE